MRRFLLFLILTLYGCSEVANASVWRPRSRRYRQAGSAVALPYQTEYAVDFETAGPDSIECPHEATTGAWTLGVWFKLDNKTGTKDFHTKWNSAVSRSWTIRHTSTGNLFTFFFGNGLGTGSPTCSGSITDAWCAAGEWCFIATDRTTVWYGAEGDTISTATPAGLGGSCPTYGTNPSVPITLGSTAGGANPLEGLIGEWWFYASGLSTSEINEARAATCASAPTPCPQDLSATSMGVPVRWYRMGDTPGDDDTTPVLIESGSGGGNCTTWNNTPQIVSGGP